MGREPDPDPGLERARAVLRTHRARIIAGGAQGVGVSRDQDGPVIVVVLAPGRAVDGPRELDGVRVRYRSGSFRPT
ncbi:hypothetical protein GC089_09580 [Cellulomonas sp. JZ18]|uniref:hypothetical protein n=1 Tax=Cellulomonas sp. JZ18 TaxID=2654191 RepID=UPI0012D3A23B|nr:hypothetical protein [Cellulomonas sp. JZ18]QGQ19434.1 hypothetical protein GC089_09580 [Cellulomonas sp. JZ18]